MRLTSLLLVISQASLKGPMVRIAIAVCILIKAP